MSNRWYFPWKGDREGRNDSLDLVELVMQLEEEFDITIPDEDAVRIHSVADAIRYLEEHRRKGGTP